jgi:hypothetical protein
MLLRRPDKGGVWTEERRFDFHGRFCGKPEGNSHLEDLRVDGTVILKLMLKK